MATKTLENIRDSISTAFTGQGFRFMEGIESDINNFHNDDFPCALLVTTETSQNLDNDWATHSYLIYCCDTFYQANMTETTTNTQDFWTPKYDALITLVHGAYTSLLADHELIVDSYNHTYLRGQYGDKLVVVVCELDVITNYYCHP